MYQDGVLSGFYCEWYSDGSLKTAGGYLRGEKHGTWTEWSPLGYPKSWKFYLLGDEIETIPERMEGFESVPAASESPCPIWGEAFEHAPLELRAEHQQK